MGTYGYPPPPYSETAQTFYFYPNMQSNPPAYVSQQTLVVQKPIALPVQNPPAVIVQNPPTVMIQNPPPVISGSYTVPVQGQGYPMNTTRGIEPVIGTGLLAGSALGYVATNAIFGHHHHHHRRHRFPHHHFLRHHHR